MHRKFRTRGFTLIELIIVIVILAILATFALPRFIGFEEQAETAVLTNTLGALRASARIAESASVATGQVKTGIAQVNGFNIAFYNGFPVARANNIGPTGPGLFDGILRLIELEGSLGIYYSDATTMVSEALVRDDYLILELSGKCIYYRPPQTAGELPEYSNGVLSFDAGTQTCS